MRNICILFLALPFVVGAQWEKHVIVESSGIINSAVAADWNGDDGWVNRLVAAWLLAPEPASEALQQQVTPLLRELALDEDGSIAAVARHKAASPRAPPTATLASPIARPPACCRPRSATPISSTARA